MTKDQEIVSLQHKISNLETDLDKVESKLSEHKSSKEDEESHKSVNENLTRKVALLESELDNAEKQLRETTDKLRQVDVKAEHFERQVARIEQERDNWEKKYEEAQAKYAASKAELDEVSTKSSFHSLPGHSRRSLAPSRSSNKWNRSKQRFVPFPPFFVQRCFLSLLSVHLRFFHSYLLLPFANVTFPVSLTSVASTPRYTREVTKQQIRFDSTANIICHGGEKRR
jgi:tropomyosin